MGFSLFNFRARKQVAAQAAAAALALATPKSSTAPKDDKPVTAADQILCVVAEGNTAALAQLLDIHGNAAANLKSSIGMPMLHYAAFKGEAATAQMLINAGAQVDAEDSGSNLGLGATALYYAAQRGYADVARVLVAAGADKTRRTTAANLKETPAEVASRMGHAELAQWLENVNATAMLMTAKQTRRIAAVRLKI